MLVISLCVIVLGLFIIFVGYSLRRKGKTSFIARNNKVFVPKDEKKLAERIGIVVISFGVETVLFPVTFRVIHGIEETHSKWKSGEITVVMFMEMLELKKNTFYKTMKEYEEAK